MRTRRRRVTTHAGDPVAESPTWASLAFAENGFRIKDASTLPLWEIP